MKLAIPVPPISMPPPPPKHIILCGFMGTGKSTVGRFVAQRLGWPFADTDSVIENRQRRTVSAIFAALGEAAFRTMERELCQELLAWPQTVIATGGGIVLDAQNRALLLKAGFVICLKAPPEVIVRRLSGQSQRPLLAGENPEVRVQNLLAARAEIYQQLPNPVDTSGQSPQLVADLIVQLWHRHNQSSR
jgi:shikimate kinase